MADGNKPLFGFQPSTGASTAAPAFGSTATSGPPKPLFGGATGSSLFGGAGTSQAPSTPSLFGSNAATPSNSSTLFGGATTGQTTPASSTLFGKPASTPATSAPSLFGSTAPTSGGFSFGPKPATTAAAPSLFGGATSSASTSSTPAPSLFGTAGAMPDSNSVFANAAKTQGTSGGLFQNLGKQQDASTPQAKPPSALSFTPAGNPPTSTSAGTGLFGGASQAATSSSNLFGAKPAENATPSFSLGGSSAGKSLFGEVKPAEKPATSLFGAAPAATPAAGSSSSNLFGNILNKKDAVSTTSAAASSLFSAATTTAPASTPSLFSTATTTAPSSAPSLFAAAQPSAPAATPSLFSAATTSAQPAATTATSGATTGGLFGGAAPTSSAPSTSSLFGAAFNKASTGATPAATTSAAPATGGLFGNAQSAAPAASTTTATAASASTATAGGLFGASVGNAPAATSTLTSQQPSSRLASKTLDEIITTWSTSLATHQKTFANVSERVAKWDRQLVQNSSAIGGLYSRVFQAERDTSEVERQLSQVEAGQRDLDNRLSHYEAEVDRLLNAAGLGDDNTANGVDSEREQTYHAAEDCQSRLTDMGQNLTAMIEEINLASNKLSTTKKASTSEDPLTQIVRVLNSHLAQLQAIDKGAQALTIKVEQAQKDAGQLAGRNGVGGNKAWVEGFGRSYLGRS